MTKKIEIFTLGFDNGDGSCTIHCFSSEEEREQAIQEKAKKMNCSKYEIDYHLTGMELGYPDKAVLELTDEGFKPFTLYMEP